MKALILSDIHSNIEALEAIWAQENDSDLVYCTGDLVDYGPHPAAVIAWVQEHAVRCVQGNHDRFLTMIYQRGERLADLPVEQRAWVHHNASLLKESDIKFLEALPEQLSFELDGKQYGLRHMYRDYEEIISLHAFNQFSAETFPECEPGVIQRLILGHTHRQAVRYLSDAQLWLNPGSVSYRRKDDPDQSAHYATITNGQISLKRLTYDVRPVFASMSQAVLKESEMRHIELFASQQLARQSSAASWIIPRS
ncbi:MAG: metallophosphoesterase family protein [Anaerolineales bacterium]|nr:metallophosphoesterase family protein [Anaerolineales bacterium]